MSNLARVSDRLPRSARRAGRRLARTTLGRTVRSRLHRPEISVIVPFYNVEDYLAECLDSVLAQTFGDFEVVLVDDGSPDGSRTIAEQYAARDHRFHVVTRSNGGLGAARNTGVRAAHGHYLTFLDSDDELPRHALAVLHDSATATGSEIVAGVMERFTSVDSWFPTWVREIHTSRQRGIRILEFLPLLRNFYTCNKLFRRGFWLAQGLWFREGVAYEDQPIVTQLMARATAIDVIPDCTYRYRLRDDGSSISQQTASVKDLRDRVAAWRVSREAIHGEFPGPVYEGWLLTLFQTHFQWYLTSPGTVDDSYWNELVAAVRELAADAPDWVWRATQPPERLLVRLAQLGRRADVQELVRSGGTSPDRWPSHVREDGVVLELPLFGDPGLSDEVFLIDPARLQVAHSVENILWTGEGDQAQCVISGRAYVQKIDLAEHDQRVTLRLRDADTGDAIDVPSTAGPVPSFALPSDDLWCDYSPGRFEARFGAADLARRGPGEWSVWLAVEVAGFTVEQPVTNLVRSGSAGVVPALTLEDGARVVPAWRFGQQLCMVVEPGAALAPEVTLTGRTLTGRIDPRWADRVTRVLASAAGGAGDAPVTDGSWTVVLPEVAPPSPGTQVSWRLRAHDRRGEPVDLLPAPGTIDTTGTGPMVIETDRTGRLRVAEWRLGAAADQVTVSTGGVLEVRGRVFGPAAANVRLLSRHKSTQVSGDEVSVRGGRFTASLELRHQRYRFGRWPLPTGNHEVQLEVDAGHGAGRVEVPLLVSATLSSQLPIPVHSDELEGRVARGPKGGVRLTLQRPLGEARTRYQESLLRRRGPSTSSLVRGVLMRSYFGEQATDNGLSIQKELQRRGSDLPVYWAVQDYSVPVPRGATPVIVNSEEWYRLVFNVEYYVDNMFQPDYHVKSGGQVLVETFHGYPFKQMGHPHWRNLQLSQARVDSYDRRTRDWDYLVSPARYATPLLTRDFGYRGEVLEIGYPRNDVLLSPDADRIRAATRASLGIGDGQIAVLYAPTFRDHLANRGEVAPMPDLLELAHTIQALGEDYCILVRGHAFNARSGSRIKDIPGCIEVTDYPEVSDLYLAADVAVVDYSSLRFDFGVTSKPMVFHVPDLERYKDGRGWLFDFEPTAPGPLCRTTDETVESLLHLDRVRDEYAAAYEAFRQDFLDLEDGRAGERLVDAIFVPRGDA